MADAMEDTTPETQETMPDTQEIEEETPPDNSFIPPSIDVPQILSGASYSYYSPIPSLIASDPSTPSVLGIDEAGRGPVLGPMVYASLYLPTSHETALLKQAHAFTDSKALTPSVRTALMRLISTPDTDLNRTCGYAATLLSAQALSAAMLSPTGPNLNAQAEAATVALIQGVLERGVNVREVYVDTVGRPESYQARLQRAFPGLRFRVEKKADALFPCVSAASVVAKVTRDAALQVLWEHGGGGGGTGRGRVAEGWGSGYPSDARCVAWLRRSVDPVFGWGAECRFSWGTARELLEGKGAGVRVEWPVEGEEEGLRVTDFFAARGEGEAEAEGDELAGWFGRRVTEEVF